MGHSQAEKQATHQRIVAIAARRFRESGLDGVGVAEVMKEAGLTVGGFYKHFASRDELVAEALGCALGGWQDRIDAAAATGTPRDFASLLTEYLSPAHRDAPGHGCAIAALAGDIARSSEHPRELYTAQLERNIQTLISLLPGEDDAKRAEALVILSAMTGALALSRATSNETLSRDILATVRDALVQREKEARLGSAQTRQGPSPWNS